MYRRREAGSMIAIPPTMTLTTTLMVIGTEIKLSTG